MDFKKFVNKYKYELIILFSICVLYAINFSVNSWMFWEHPNSSYIDKWIYVGYFRYLGDFIHYFGLTPYYSGRISWIMPGYIINALFPALTAHYLLHLIMLVCVALSLFYIVKILFDNQTACITTLLMLFYPEFIKTIGSDYISSALITYMLLTLLALTIGAKFNHWKLSLIFGGIFCASMIYANMFAVIFLPFIFAFYIIINRQYNKNPFSKSLLYFSLGSVLITCVFGIFLYLTSGQFDFISEQFSRLIFYSVVDSVYDIPILMWFGKAPYLILSISGFIGGCLFLIINHLKKNTLPQLTKFLIVNFICLFIVFFILQIKPNPAPVLQYSYYACYLIPFLFLALAAILSHFIKNIKERSVLLLSIIIILFSTISFANFGLFSTITKYNFTIGEDFKFYLFGLVMIIVWVILFASLTLKQNNKRAVAVFLICIIVSTMCFYPAHPNQWLRVGSVDASNQYEVLSTGGNIIHTKIPDGNVRFWYNRTDKYGGLYSGINSMYLYGYTLFSKERFPNLTQNDIIRTMKKDKNMRIVIFSDRDDTMIAAQKTLNLYGYNITLLDCGTVEKENVKINYYITTIRNTTEQL